MLKCENCSFYYDSYYWELLQRCTTAVDNGEITQAEADEIMDGAKYTPSCQCGHTWLDAPAPCEVEESYEDESYYGEDEEEDYEDEDYDAELERFNPSFDRWNGYTYAD